MEKLYVGKAKALYATDNPDELLVEYSNQATALNGLKKENIEGKGVLNNQISAIIYQYLNKHGIKTQFVDQVDDNKQIVKKLEMIPVEVVIRNILAGSLAKKMDKEEGTALLHPTVEFYYKNDDLGDPFLNTSQLSALDIVDEATANELSEFALEINALLIDLFAEISIELVDLKFEFGRDKDGQIILGDEISPDTCRLWDKETKDKFDKDNFRHDLGSIIPKYQKVYERLTSFINK